MCAHPCSSSASTPSLDGGPAPLPVRPWSEVKSRRGAPKRIHTDGYACPNQQCPYCGITDAHIHALVGDGTHGRAERIQTFRCQACHTTFSARRDTPLYRLKTPSYSVATVLSAQAEELDPSAAERVFSFRQATITSLSDTRSPCTHTPCTSAHISSSPPLTCPVGPLLRTRLRCARQMRLSLAGHRPLHQASSRALSGSPDTTHGPPAHPLPATDAGSGLPPTLYQ